MENQDNHKYDDIINLPNPTSKKHPRMSLYDRAAQFSPFAALTGHEAAIKETVRQTDAKQVLSEEVIEELNKKLYIDRKTGKPIKMQIKNVSKNTTVYILYNEIEINSLKRDDVLAFRLKNVYVNM